MYTNHCRGGEGFHFATHNGIDWIEQQQQQHWTLEIFQWNFITFILLSYRHKSTREYHTQRKSDSISVVRLPWRVFTWSEAECSSEEVSKSRTHRQNWNFLISQTRNVDSNAILTYDLSENNSNSNSFFTDLPGIVKCWHHVHIALHHFELL